MSPRSSTESYPAFARIGLKENPGKNLNQVTCPDRDSNPGHLVSRPDALTVTPQVQRSARTIEILMSNTLCIYERISCNNCLNSCRCISLRIEADELPTDKRALAGVNSERLAAMGEPAGAAPEPSRDQSTTGDLIDPNHAKRNDEHTLKLSDLVLRQNRTMTVRIQSLLKLAYFHRGSMRTSKSSCEIEKRRFRNLVEDKLAISTTIVQQVILRRFINSFGYLASERDEGDNAGEMSPGSNTVSYPAFAHIGLRENPGKNLNQAMNSCCKISEMPQKHTKRRQSYEQFSCRMDGVTLNRPCKQRGWETVTQMNVSIENWFEPRNFKSNAKPGNHIDDDRVDVLFVL
ncbi:hypothetical protein ANN_16804 [Periplaneta americana]|uniref:Uncharacterized protein n=1 Tax=Periplaneta americana TaxID=6978 RepID=A0ABQ8SRQ3_PERAM|nr:hypothetical protein ANN_16804 [Periplaneta americana]